MTRRVARRRDDPDLAITKHVVVSIQGHAIRVLEMSVVCRVEAGNSHRIGKCRIVFGSLDQQCRANHLIGNANMVEVHVGKRRKIERVHAEAHISQLLGERPIQSHLYAFAVPAFHLGNSRRQAAIPE